MYSINTQLDYFKFGPDPKRMLANITWFKCAAAGDLKIQAVPLEDFEIEEFKNYIEANPCNFPGQYFIEKHRAGDQNAAPLNSPSTSGFPSWLLLSDDRQLQSGSDIIYKVMPAVLTDESCRNQKAYGLGFAVLGKIQVYKINK